MHELRPHGDMFSIMDRVEHGGQACAARDYHAEPFVPVQLPRVTRVMLLERRWAEASGCLMQ